MEGQRNFECLVQWVLRCPRLFVLTGAGCSTESGIPDYRDRQGQWKRKPPIQHQDFLNSDLARRRYWARSLVGWRIMARAQPGPAHLALARLERAGRIHTLVTQNVDGLHQAAGSQHVIDLHGRISEVICLQCGALESRQTMQTWLEQANGDWLHLAADAAPDGDADLEGLDFSRLQVPDCPRCGGLLKPHVVFFGDSVPRDRLQAALAAQAQCQATLVVGSSLSVYSGYRFCLKAQELGQSVAALNQGWTRADDLLTLKLQAPIGAGLSALIERLGA